MTRETKIGLVVAATTSGSAVPHLLNASAGGMPPWRGVLLLTSALAAVAAVIAGLLVRPGPFLGQAPPFDWRFAGRALARSIQDMVIAEDHRVGCPDMRP